MADDNLTPKKEIVGNIEFTYDPSSMQPCRYEIPGTIQRGQSDETNFGKYKEQIIARFSKDLRLK